MKWKGTATGHLETNGSQSADFTGHESGDSHDEAIKEAKLNVTKQIRDAFDSQTFRAGKIEWSNWSAVIDLG